MADESRQAWYDDINDERAAELEHWLQAWEQEGNSGKQKGPFDPTGHSTEEWERLQLTGADVFWLAARTLAGTNEVQAVAEQKELFRRTGLDVVSTQSDLSGLNLAYANLLGAHLSFAKLLKVKLIGANLFGAKFDGAILDGADLSGADLKMADFTGAGLYQANLTGAELDDFPKLMSTTLTGADLREANLTGVDLRSADLTRAELEGANLTGADLSGITLKDVKLDSADLTGARLNETSLLNVRLNSATLARASLVGAALTNVRLNSATLKGANLTRVTLDPTTDLTNVQMTDLPGPFAGLIRRLRRQPIYGPASLADIHWNDVDLTVVDWSNLRRLGDERSKQWWWRNREESERATRANTQLAKRLRDAGMNDDADRFAYRAQVRQRGVHLLRLRFGRWLFSWLLFVVAGYGYRPLRTLFCYLAVIFGFALLYMHFGHINGQPFEFDEALVFSVTSFHGRGFFPGTLDLKDLVTKLAASEAVFGLFIEVSFIATFTQRYFGK